MRFKTTPNFPRFGLLKESYWSSIIKTNYSVQMLRAELCHVLPTLELVIVAHERASPQVLPRLLPEKQALYRKFLFLCVDLSVLFRENIFNQIFGRVRVLFGPKATLGFKFSARPHIYASLLPLIIFTIAHILSIGESPLPISLDFDHVLFGTLSVEIRHCSPLRFSSSFPRALPSTFGGPLSGTEVSAIYFYATSLFSHGCEPRCCSDNREAERKARARPGPARHCRLRPQLPD